MTWQDKALAECAVFRSGGTPNKGRPEYWGGDIPWVSSGEMTKQFITDTSLRITEAGAAAGSRLVPAGTMFVVVRGMSLAKEFRVSYATRDMAFNQDLKALTAKDGIDPYFLFSALRAHAPAIQELATEAAHGTKKLEMERLQSYSIRVPDLDTQVRIAAEARNLDDLIENNQRRIALLEEAAHLLFNKWFAPSRVTRADGCEKPEGRCERNLYDIADLTMGYPFQSALFNTEGDGRPAVRIRDIPSSTVSTWTTEDPGDPAYEILQGDLLVGMDGIFHMNHWVGEPSWLVQRVCRIRPKNPLHRGFLPLALAEPIKHFEATIAGATVAHLGAKHLRAINLVMPPESMQCELQRLNDFLDQRLMLHAASELAKKARNALLPKLLSGDLTI